jgi:hypothetical protein
MYLTERFAAAAKAFFTLGQKGDESIVAEIENGKPKANQVYRCITAARGFLGYAYVCNCGGFTHVSGGRFAHLEASRCINCGRNFCIADWFKADMNAARVAQAKESGQKEKTGAFSHVEELLCEGRLPYYKVGTPQSSRQRNVDNIRKQLELGDGELVTYTGNHAGHDDYMTSDEVAFGDPYAMSLQRRAFAGRGEQRTVADREKESHDQAVEEWRSGRSQWKPQR